MKSKDKKKEDSKKKYKILKLGKLEIKYTKSDIFGLILIFMFIFGMFISPKYYSVTTGLYNKGSEEDNKNVINALGSENTEERFEIYFQWYNVIHELGHGLLYYGDGVDVHVVDEEQLVNDFAVAYWRYYGEEEKLNTLEDIVNYAVVNVGDSHKNGVDYIKLGKENSNGESFDNSFFNFNDYGWFQFSSVKKSLESNKTLDSVLKEMGIKNYKLNDKKLLIYEDINQEVSTKIINDAVSNFNEWGIDYPKAIHHFDNDPNNNYSKPVVKLFWLIEYPDLGYIFS